MHAPESLSHGHAETNLHALPAKPCTCKKRHQHAPLVLQEGRATTAPRTQSAPTTVEKPECVIKNGYTYFILAGTKRDCK